MIKVDKRVNRVLLLGAALVPFGVAVAEEGSRRIEEVIVSDSHGNGQSLLYENCWTMFRSSAHGRAHSA